MTKTILLIEDLPSHAILVIKFLEHIGIQVIWKASAEEGLIELTKVVPDLFLIDISLPGISGLQFLKTLKENPALSHIPTIAVTAHAIFNAKEEFLAQGFTDYIAKPFPSALLISTVKKHLKMKEDT